MVLAVLRSQAFFFSAIFLSISWSCPASAQLLGRSADQQDVDAFGETAIKSYRLEDCAETDEPERCKVNAVRIPVATKAAGLDFRECNYPIRTFGTNAFFDEDGNPVEGFTVAGKVRVITTNGGERRRFGEDLTLLLQPLEEAKNGEVTCLPARVEIDGFRMVMPWVRDPEILAGSRAVAYLRSAKTPVPFGDEDALGGILGGQIMGGIIGTRVDPRRGDVGILATQDMGEDFEGPIPDEARLSWSEIIEVIFGRQSTNLLNVRVSSLPKGMGVFDGQDQVAETTAQFLASKETLKRLTVKTEDRAIPLQQCEAFARPSAVEFRCSQGETD